MKNVTGGFYAPGRILLGYGRNSQRALLALLLTFIAGLTSGAAVADEMSLLVNGKAIHINTPAGRNLNENNWGLGLQYDWDLADSKWRPFATVSGFNDSNHNPSYYAGGGAPHPFQFCGIDIVPGSTWVSVSHYGFNNRRPLPAGQPPLYAATTNF